jgi:hypothetical protein
MQGASERQGEMYLRYNLTLINRISTGDSTMFTMQDLRDHYRFTDQDAELLLPLVQKDNSKA